MSRLRWEVVLGAIVTDAASADALEAAYGVV